VKADSDTETGQLLEHGRIHAAFDVAEAVAGLRNKEANTWTFEEAKVTGVAATSKTLGNKCDPACVAAVIEATHQGDRKKPLRAFCPKKKDAPDRVDAKKITDALRGAFSKPAM
jgi:prolyl-tRNA editing enzyme YbaK/EbsC (Cys-tRNA(Pro) deacylase)